jgi:diacylglycerol kinase (ATP)
VMSVAPLPTPRQINNMGFNHIHFIINPAAGKEEPILSYINNVFGESNINWDISVTKKNGNTAGIVRSLVNKTDLIAVYGGDGSVTEVAGLLHNGNMPMAIIPGGTANVMAKELNIPIETVAALELLKGNNYTTKAIDMGLVNDHPFLLRVNLGIMADMVLQTDRKLKNNLGQLAYGITAFKTIADAGYTKYKLEIDGETIEETGVSLTVTNSGNIGIGDFALQPGISITDGLLDVILLNNANITSLLKVAGSTLLQSETDAVKHWQCRQITIRMEKEHKYICDDCEKSASILNIKVVPGSIKIVVPAEN